MLRPHGTSTARAHSQTWVLSLWFFATHPARKPRGMMNVAGEPPQVTHRTNKTANHASCLAIADCTRPTTHLGACIGSWLPWRCMQRCLCTGHSITWPTAGLAEQCGTVLFTNKPPAWYGLKQFSNRAHGTPQKSLHGLSWHIEYCKLLENIGVAAANCAPMLRRGRQAIKINCLGTMKRLTLLIWASDTMSGR